MSVANCHLCARAQKETKKKGNGPWIIEQIFTVSSYKHTQKVKGKKNIL